MEDMTYLGLVKARDHARDMWQWSANSGDSTVMADALDYLCCCQQRLEKREGKINDTERKDSTST